jgi:hypothetical protein
MPPLHRIRCLSLPHSNRQLCDCRRVVGPRDSDVGMCAVDYAVVATGVSLAVLWVFILACKYRARPLAAASFILDPQAVQARVRVRSSLRDSPAVSSISSLELLGGYSRAQPLCHAVLRGERTRFHAPHPWFLPQHIMVTTPSGVWRWGAWVETAWTVELPLQRMVGLRAPGGETNPRPHPRSKLNRNWVCR